MWKLAALDVHALDPVLQLLCYAQQVHLFLGMSAGAGIYLRLYQQINVFDSAGCKAWILTSIQTSGALCLDSFFCLVHLGQYRVCSMAQFCWSLDSVIFWCLRSTWNSTHSPPRLKKSWWEQMLQWLLVTYAGTHATSASKKESNVRWLGWNYQWVVVWNLHEDSLGDLQRRLLLLPLSKVVASGVPLPQTCPLLELPLKPLLLKADSLRAPQNPQSLNAPQHKTSRWRSLWPSEWRGSPGSMICNVGYI